MYTFGLHNYKMSLLMKCDVNEQFSGKSRSIRYNPLIVKKLGTH